MIKLDSAVIVEGRYDRIRLSSILDAVIIETGGFQIFKDREKLELIRTLARRCGIVVMTDSDAAGFAIRRHIGSAVDPKLIKHVYIPQTKGVERRKRVPSREGYLGVEGQSEQALLEALKRVGVGCGHVESCGRKITKFDFYQDGLSGGHNSAKKRQKLLENLGLPKYLSANSLVSVLNVIMSYEEYKAHTMEL